MYLYGFFMILIFGVVCLGWIAFLIVGIYRKKRKLSGSTVFIVLGSIWAVPGIAISALAIFAFYQFSQYEPAETVVFNPETYAGQTGTIALSYTDKATVEFYTTNTMINYQMTSSNGLITAPTGKLALHQFEAEKDDAQGTWSISAYFWDREDFAVNVSPDHMTSLNIGPPLTAKIIAKPKADRNVSLNFQLKGADRTDYSINNPNKRREIPHFEIKDKRGEIVLSGKFSYG